MLHSGVAWVEKWGGGEGIGQYHFGRAFFPSHPVYNSRPCGRGCKSKFLQRSSHLPRLPFIPTQYSTHDRGGAKFFRRNAHFLPWFFLIRYTTVTTEGGPRNHSGGGKGRLEGEDTSPLGGHFFPSKRQFFPSEGNLLITKTHFFFSSKFSGNNNQITHEGRAPWARAQGGPDSPLEGLLCPPCPPCLETRSTFSHPKDSFFSSQGHYFISKRHFFYLFLFFGDQNTINPGRQGLSQSTGGPIVPPLPPSQTLRGGGGATPRPPGTPGDTPLMIQHISTDGRFQNKG